MANKPIAEIGAWLGMIEPKRTAIHSVKKADPDEVIAEIKVHWEAWFNYFIPGLFESKSFRAAIATMPKEATSWDGNTACEAAWNLANTLVLVKSRIKHDEPAPPFGDYDVEMDSNQKYWKEQQKNFTNI